MKMDYCRYLSRKASVDVDDAMLARLVHAVSMQSQEGEEGGDGERRDGEGRDGEGEERDVEIQNSEEVTVREEREEEYAREERE